MCRSLPTFLLGTKPGKEVYVEPTIKAGGYRLHGEDGAKPKNAEEAKNGT